VILQDDAGVEGYFRRYPYADGDPGFMYRDGWSEPRPAPGSDAVEVLGLGRWSVRGLVEESNDFDGLNRATLHLLLETTSRLGLQTSWTYLQENLNGCWCGRRWDEMVLGDVNLVYRFAQHDRAQFRAGIGARFLADNDLFRAGFNFTYGMDLYPVKPWVFSTTLDAGTLGHAGVFHIRATAGYMLNRFEIYGGYDYMRIGAVDLQGPVLGLRVWF
jgi:hypothetical protein